MNGVADLLANGGQPSATKSHSPSTNCGIRFGVKLILLGILLAPLCLGISFAIDAAAPLFAPLTVFLAGVLWLVYSLIFKEDPIAQNGHRRQSPAELNDARTPHLSSPHTLNVSPSRAADTGEMFAPSAITDHTTRLLD